ncbi:hypothetical protein P154DRAFT_608696 [Amniculicola lignicola CBS 123094]|uniref:NAD(P)-binding protein n=1 Tax=Amniculicola lignicola CBS 123094 TaxID=1392246 RepID=A0A6A5WV33_9PLEO|nr:hypothetical protein P154DRAFT_608696 [Amniculicola lignicola CBS 123094]
MRSRIHPRRMRRNRAPRLERGCLRDPPSHPSLKVPRQTNKSKSPPTQSTSQTVNSRATTFGSIDYVVNGAGITTKHEGGAAFAKTLDWQKFIDINLTGKFFVL